MAQKDYFQGDLINLTCLTSGGNPPPEVAWYKNNIKLQVMTMMTMTMMMIMMMMMMMMIYMMMMLMVTFKNDLQCSTSTSVWPTRAQFPTWLCALRRVSLQTGRHHHKSSSSSSLSSSSPSSSSQIRIMITLILIKHCHIDYWPGLAAKLGTNTLKCWQVQPSSSM